MLESCARSGYITAVLEHELSVAIHLAREAGKILLEIYAQDFSVAYKTENDPVTEADKRANEMIVTALKRAFPNDGIVAEESADTSAISQTHGRTWYVDPLDGTKEFIKKNGEFSVMIGLSIDGSAELGVVYRPVGDVLYAGVVGGESFVEQAGKKSPLRVSDVSDPAKLRLVVSRSHRSAETDQLVRELGIAEERASGSVGLKIGLIAEREADVYVHISNKSSAWDACAPDAILRAAGGVFADLFGERFVYGRGEIQNVRGIFACNESAFSRVAPAVKNAAIQAGFHIPSAAKI